MRRRFKPAALAELLLRKGLDDAELARRTGLSHVTIRKARRGGPVYMSTIRKVGDVIDSTPDVLVAAELTEAVA